MELRDGELVLRPIDPADAEALAAALSDSEIVRFIPGIPSPYTQTDAEAWVARCGNVWRTGESYPFLIVDAESGEVLGSIELHAAGRTVGYWVAAGARGGGVATRALRLLCEWTDERPLWLTTHPDNIASQRVAEKAGFHRIGNTTDHPVFQDGTREAALFELD